MPGGIIILSIVSPRRPAPRYGIIRGMEGNYRMSVTYTYWQDPKDGMWLGYWNDYPDRMTEGYTHEDLKRMLVSLRADIREMVADGTMPDERRNVAA